MGVLTIATFLVSNKEILARLNIKFRYKIYEITVWGFWDFGNGLGRQPTYAETLNVSVHGK